ncbi:transposase [Zoogloea oleivorans]|uniref:Transposase n=2 Tax=Zoogloea oleivorans TaxID=1552750 RepID=A0A6C2CLX9_9RHOO|nr:transposase [Zoogloea oleivorans]
MSHRRHELFGAEWALLEPLLPAATMPGRYYLNHRTILNGMLFHNATGIPWRDRQVAGVYRRLECTRTKPLLTRKDFPH